MSEDHPASGVDVEPATVAGPHRRAPRPGVEPDRLGHPKVDDRYVVSARDLVPWFAEDEADPEVLSRAPADFGQMIITRAEYDEAKRARLDAAEAARHDAPSSDDGR